MATWLDTACYPFDRAILGAIHAFTKSTGNAFGWLMHFLGFIGELGICFILLGLVLFCFKKTRRRGLFVLFALAFGALFTNILLKNIVSRPRPFTDLAKPFVQWWQYVGAPAASKNSFPSGHTTSAFAAMGAMFLSSRKKKFAWTYLLIGLLMGFSRMYIMVHYPTDVLAGILSGCLAAVCAYFLIKLVYSLLEKHREKRFCRFFLDFDLAVWIKGVLGKRTQCDCQASQETARDPADGQEKNT